jgi:hypothetical protein
VEDFLETSMQRATGWKRQPVRRTTLARQTDEDVSGEYLGATYKMLPSLQRQEGDHLLAGQRVPHGVGAYTHPQYLTGWALDPGGPRIMPVSQRIEQGPECDRQAEFERGAGLALHNYYLVVGWRDRRHTGRRPRGTDNGGEAVWGPQEPYA